MNFLWGILTLYQTGNGTPKQLVLQNFKARKRKFSGFNSLYSDLLKFLNYWRLIFIFRAVTKIENVFTYGGKNDIIFLI